MTDDGVPSITPEELKRRLDAVQGVTLLDVRNRNEVESWRVEGPGIDLHHVPQMKFTAARVTGGVADLVADVPEPMVVVCPRGEASREVAEQLTAEGTDAANLAGGMYGWARLYQAHTVCKDSSVVQYQRPASGCLAYLVVSSGEAVVVDPLRAFTDRYAADLAECDAILDYVIDTHVHADHVSGLRSLVGETNATPVMSERAVARGVEYDAETVADGDILCVGDAELQVVATPGHTTGMVSLYLRDAGVLLTGDTLFVDGVPRPDLEEGVEGAADAARDLHRTLTERLARFSDDTLVAPGHYRPGTTPAEDGTFTATLGDLRNRLAAFEQSEEAFVESVLADVPPRPANYERIVEINLGRESADADEAFELELGPNNCAAAPAD